ncbi:ATP-grasp domain-containing protein [Lysinibacillus endophyticus]|uniref:ATP-grasp domain-containing protein n=1 Tax=Ureibacillus endophyticus TaxID=1978490 RepID=UPI0020A128E3|nr:ATP-grasp domain-containing protein [Lysinibacillus endophyticus]MCP1146554.1 ATP-grasp domain-containing protein [Lysinibacillus endophyticus]
MEMKQIHGKTTALLGWSLQAIEAIDKMNRPYVVVGPPEFKPFADKNGIQFVPWQFDVPIEHSMELYEKLKELDTKVAVPIYEETVEWAGMLNSLLWENPRVFNKSLLLRDKSLMKRRAHLAGLRVGVFEEAFNKEDVAHFLKRMNEALLNMDEENYEPIHVKPFDKAGTVGHRMIKKREDIEEIDDSEFPLLMESHLEGQEFSCEAFVHNGKVHFLNITEYVKLGHSNFVPASPTLEQWRPQIRETIEQLVKAFEVENGILHPEFFITPNGTIYFGEVAARIPGGHIFEHIERVYGFSPYQGQILCCDPETTDEELKAFFPEEVVSAKGHSGNLMVYPKVKSISKLNIPDELKEHPYFLKHNMFLPATSKVSERVGFGNHYGSIYFFGEDSTEMRKLLEQYEKHDFYL